MSIGGVSQQKRYSSKTLSKNIQNFLVLQTQQVHFLKTLSKNIQNFLGGLATQPRPLPGKPRPPRLARFLPVACLLQQHDTYHRFGGLSARYPCLIASWHGLCLGHGPCISTYHAMIKNRAKPSPLPRETPPGQFKHTRKQGRLSGYTRIASAGTKGMP